MQKLFISVVSVLLFSSQIIAQNLVSTSVLPRNTVLEQFTGVNCQFCPDGDERAEILKAAFPNRVSLIYVHSGLFANPSPGQPDYRTPYGDAIDSLATGTAYPYGTINRSLFPGTYSQPPYFPQNPPDNLALRRQGWWDNAYPTTGAGAVIVLQGGNSKVNIGAAAIWDAPSRELNITVELYYTSNEFQNNQLNVVLTENGLIGDQAGWGPNYHHNHVLRDMITGQWGDTVTTTSVGTLVSRNYIYTVPISYNIDSCELTIFVTQNDKKNTHTTITIPAKNGTTVGLSEVANSNFSVFPNPAEDVLFISGITNNKSNLIIIDLLGKVILEKQVEKDFYQMDISSLEKGIYFIVVDSGRNKVVKRFVKF